MVATLDQQAYNAVAHSAAGVIRQKQDGRFRRQHRFWLDTMKQADSWLDEQIEILKGKRQYSRAVRDGLRLFLDLKAGRTTVLFELFPMLKSQIENDLLRAMLADQAQPVAVGQGPKPLGKVIPMTTPPPAEADDSALLSIKKAASDGKAASAKSFLDAAFNLQP